MRVLCACAHVCACVYVRPRHAGVAEPVVMDAAEVRELKKAFEDLQVCQPLSYH